MLSCCHANTPTPVQFEPQEDDDDDFNDSFDHADESESDSEEGTGEPGTTVSATVPAANGSFGSNTAANPTPRASSASASAHLNDEQPEPDLCYTYTVTSLGGRGGRKGTVANANVFAVHVSARQPPGSRPNSTFRLKRGQRIEVLKCVIGPVTELLRGWLTGSDPGNPELRLQTEVLRFAWKHFPKTMQKIHGVSSAGQRDFSAETRQAWATFLSNCSVSNDFVVRISDERHSTAVKSRRSSSRHLSQKTKEAEHGVHRFYGGFLRKHAGFIKDTVCVTGVAYTRFRMLSYEDGKEGGRRRRVRFHGVPMRTAPGTKVGNREQAARMKKKGMSVNCGTTKIVRHQVRMSMESVNAPTKISFEKLVTQACVTTSAYNEAPPPSPVRVGPFDGQARKLIASATLAAAAEKATGASAASAASASDSSGTPAASAAASTSAAEDVHTAMLEPKAFGVAHEPMEFAMICLGRMAREGTLNPTAAAAILNRTPAPAPPAAHGECVALKCAGRYSAQLSFWPDGCPPQMAMLSFWFVDTSRRLVAGDGRTDPIPWSYWKGHESSAIPIMEELLPAMLCKHRLEFPEYGTYIELDLTLDPNIGPSLGFSGDHAMLCEMLGVLGGSAHCRLHWTQPIFIQLIDELELQVPCKPSDNLVWRVRTLHASLHALTVALNLGSMFSAEDMVAVLAPEPTAANYSTEKLRLGRLGKEALARELQALKTYDESSVVELLQSGSCPPKVFAAAVRLYSAARQATGRASFGVLVGKNESAFRLIAKAASELRGDSDSITKAGAGYAGVLLQWEDMIMNKKSRASLLARSAAGQIEEWIKNYSKLSPTNGVDIDCCFFGLSIDHSLTARLKVFKDLLLAVDEESMRSIILLALGKGPDGKIMEYTSGQRWRRLVYTPWKTFGNLRPSMYELAVLLSLSQEFFAKPGRPTTAPGTWPKNMPFLDHMPSADELNVGTIIASSCMIELADDNLEPEPVRDKTGGFADGRSKKRKRKAQQTAAAETNAEEGGESEDEEAERESLRARVDDLRAGSGAETTDDDTDDENDDIIVDSEHEEETETEDEDGADSDEGDGGGDGDEEGAAGRAAAGLHEAEMTALGYDAADRSFRDRRQRVGASNGRLKLPKTRAKRDEKTLRTYIDSAQICGTEYVKECTATKAVIFGDGALSALLLEEIRRKGEQPGRNFAPGSLRSLNGQEWLTNLPIDVAFVLALTAAGDGGTHVTAIVTTEVQLHGEDADAANDIARWASARELPVVTLQIADTAKTMSACHLTQLSEEQFRKFARREISLAAVVSAAKTNNRISHQPCSHLNPRAGCMHCSAVDLPRGVLLENRKGGAAGLAGMPQSLKVVEAVVEHLHRKAVAAGNGDVDAACGAAKAITAADVCDELRPSHTAVWLEHVFGEAGSVDAQVVKAIDDWIRRVSPLGAIRTDVRQRHTTALFETDGWRQSPGESQPQDYWAGQRVISEWRVTKEQAARSRRPKKLKEDAAQPEGSEDAGSWAALVLGRASEADEKQLAGRGQRRVILRIQFDDKDQATDEYHERLVDQRFVQHVGSGPVGRFDHAEEDAADYDPPKKVLHALPAL